METCVENVIEELSKINNAAEGFADSMEEAKKNLEKDYTAKKDAFDLEQSNAVNEHLEQLKEQLSKENKDKIEALHREYEISMAKVEEKYEKCHMELAKEIAEKIISERL